MDNIDPLHYKMLQYGGNRKFLQVMSMYQIDNNDENRGTKYITKAAEMYRKQLMKAAVADEDFTLEDSRILSEISL